MNTSRLVVLPTAVRNRCARVSERVSDESKGTAVGGLPSKEQVANSSRLKAE